MACLELDSPQLMSSHPLYDKSFNLHIVESISDESFSAFDASTPGQSTYSIIPQPPPPPRFLYLASKGFKSLTGYTIVPEQTKEAWDRLFKEGYGADVQVLTDDGGSVLAHSSILGVASPILRNMLEESKVRGGFMKIRIPGMPLEAVHGFIRFLYSSCYEPDIMEKFVLHLFVMSHTFSIPSLKMACTELLEKDLLTMDNVVDVLQLSRECDAPRLSLVCVRLIIRNFKTISVSEGWKIMKKSDPCLEQEILECLVEEDSKLQERLKKIEERKVYTQLYEAMEALVHICRDGCQTIGPRDKMLKGSGSICKFSACKGLESLLRHFSSCKVRVPGGCAQCKRMWQLLELHSRMCAEPDSCKVPLCRHLKDKMQHMNKKEEMKWKLLGSKVLSAKGTISSIKALGLMSP